MARYALLVVTWLFIGVIVIHLWIVRGGDPPIPLLVILAAISLIPLAARLKIGNWLDFTKKVEHLSADVSSAKDQIHQMSTQLTNVSNLVNTFLVSKQSQQQWNISLINEEVLKAFADAMPPRREELYPPPDVKKTSDPSLMSVYWVWSADETIALAIPSLWAFYATNKSLREHRRIKAEEVIGGETRLSIIQKIRDDMKWLLEGKQGEQFEEHLQSLETLYKVREDVYKGDSEPPSEEEGAELLKKGHMAAMFFLGAVSIIPYAILEHISNVFGMDNAIRRTEPEQDHENTP